MTRCLAAHVLYLGTAGFAAPGNPAAITNLRWAHTAAHGARNKIKPL